jgi:uncharacterized protein YbjT (DUF2867 family)
MQDRLVTMFGGGGFLGRYVAQELLKAGIRIRIAERNPSNAYFIKPMGGLGQTQFVTADITKPETLPRALEGADAVINFVGILKGDFQKFHIDGPKNAAEAAKAAGVADFMQISSIGASPEATSHYARSKAAGEGVVRDAMPQAIIMRPSVVFGPEDGFLNRFAALARMAPFMVPVMRPDTKFQPAYVVDIAQAVSKMPLPIAGKRSSWAARRFFRCGRSTASSSIISAGPTNRFSRYRTCWAGQWREWASCPARRSAGTSGSPCKATMW